MKSKIIKKIRRVVIYTEYQSGLKRLEQDLPDEVKRLIAKSYIDELFYRKDK